MVGTAVYSGLVLADIEDSKANEQTIEVTGEQFAWTFEYAEGRQFRSGELHLVKDTPYHFKLNAKDVLHSFWVPQFRMKKDAVPGITTDVRVTPTRLGRYTLTCAELCGLGHSTMRATVVVEEPGRLRPLGRAAAQRQGTAARRRGPAAGRPGRGRAGAAGAGRPVRKRT